MEVKSSWNRWHHQRQFPHSRFVDDYDHGHHHHRHPHRYHKFPHHQNHQKKLQKQWCPSKKTLPLHNFKNSTIALVQSSLSYSILFTIHEFLTVIIRRSPGTRLSARPQQQPRRESTGGEAMLSKRSRSSS